MTANELAELLTEAALEAFNQKFSTIFDLHPLGLRITMRANPLGLQKIIPWQTLISANIDVCALYLNNMSKEMEAAGAKPR